jgi:hypothetical protein
MFIPAISELYSTLCYVEGDLSRVPKPGKYSHHIHDLFYQVKFDVILSLGLTEFKAFIAWKENVRDLFLNFSHYTERGFYERRVKKKGQG